jgi:hypothetical protein
MANRGDPGDCSEVPEYEVVLDLKHDGELRFHAVDSVAVVKNGAQPKDEMFPIEVGDTVCMVNGVSVSRLTFQQIRDSVEKNSLGLVALRFRRPSKTYAPVKFGTRVGLKGGTILDNEDDEASPAPKKKRKVQAKAKPKAKRSRKKKAATPKADSGGLGSGGGNGALSQKQSGPAQPMFSRTNITPPFRARGQSFDGSPSRPGLRGAAGLESLRRAGSRDSDGGLGMSGSYMMGMMGPGMMGAMNGGGWPMSSMGPMGMYGMGGMGGMGMGGMNMYYQNMGAMDGGGKGDDGGGDKASGVGASVPGIVDLKALAGKAKKKKTKTAAASNNPTTTTTDDVKGN